MHDTAGTPVHRTTVVAEDGIPLVVREYGPPDAALTVVFLHGHCLRAQSWFPMRDLLTEWTPRVRMVFYDHRGHGESGLSPAGSCTIDQLGRDLDTVLAAVAPHGPVVLIGHSMGGMAVLACVRQRPGLVHERLVGIALISTAASGLADAGLGRILRTPVIPVFGAAVRWAPRATAGSKRFGAVLGTAAVAAVTGRGRRVTPGMLAVTAAMVGQTSVVTIAGFLRTFVDYDESATVPTLTGIPAVVVCGTADVLTPPARSEAIAALLPGAELVRIPGGGHSVILDRAPEVAAAVGTLLARACSDRLTSAS